MLLPINQGQSMSSRRVPNRKDRVCMNMIRVYRTARSAPGSRERPIFSIGWIGWISQPKRPKSDGTDLRHWSRLKQMEAFLPPIEKPQGLIMKFVYTMTRRQFGKVITPLKCIPHGCRLHSICSIRRSLSWIKSYCCRRRPPCFSVNRWRVSTSVFSAQHWTM
jgi:hypothetical protein